MNGYLGIIVFKKYASWEMMHWNMFVLIEKCYYTEFSGDISHWVITVLKFSCCWNCKFFIFIEWNYIFFFFVWYIGYFFCVNICHKFPQWKSFNNYTFILFRIQFLIYKTATLIKTMNRCAINCQKVYFNNFGIWSSMYD